jgi:S-DNA-T family DNA segregation ATPase FtsK/SpoIIIE
MNASTVLHLLVAGGAIVVAVWVLNKVGKALASVLEALATVAMVLLALWLVAKAGYTVIKTAVTHWRTTLALTCVTAWVWWWGWLSIAVTVAVVAAGLLGWRWQHRSSFEVWAGRWLRSWWLRWTVYARWLPRWLRACGLTVQDSDRPIVLTANPLGRNKLRRQPRQRVNQVPRVLGVRSGASWDEVRVRLVPGQKPEDFDEAARALAVARGVERCQVRELKPRVVSIDFQRRNLLEETVSCPELADLAEVPGSSISRSWVRTPCTPGSPGRGRVRRCGAR